MTWEIPWVIAGVDEVPIDVARVVTYAATSGAEGIIGPTDLAVLQTDTASNQIQVYPGTFVCLNRFLGAQYESYIGRNASSSDVVTVPNTSSATRSDLVYAHITDPGQVGQPSTAAPVQTRVITGVNPGTTALSQVAGYENQSGLALARIDRPANSTVVTQAQITQLRTVANPRSEYHTRIYNKSTAVSGSQFDTKPEYAAVSTTFSTFPAGGQWTVDIPEWATQVAVSCTISPVALVVSSINSDEPAWLLGNTRLRVSSGSTAAYTPQTMYASFLTVGQQAQSDRVTLLCAGDIAIPESLRGTTQPLALEFNVLTGGAGSVCVSAGTSIVVQLNFVEYAEAA